MLIIRSVFYKIFLLLNYDEQSTHYYTVCVFVYVLEIMQCFFFFKSTLLVIFKNIFYASLYYLEYILKFSGMEHR